MASGRLKSEMSFAQGAQEGEMKIYDTDGKLSGTHFNISKASAMALLLSLMRVAKSCAKCAISTMWSSEAEC